jgi:hypothetical protein
MIRSLKHYFEKKNEFYTENLEPSYTNWNILKCKDLYLSKVSDLQREQSSQLLTEKTIFHAYWHGTFGLKQAFSIKSLLCTQNMESIEIWLWLDSENGYAQIESNPHLQELKGHIKILSWKLAILPFAKLRHISMHPRILQPKVTISGLSLSTNMEVYISILMLCF